MLTFPQADARKSLIIREEEDDEEEEFEIEKIEEWTVEKTRTLDHEDFEASLIKETKTFIIIGVQLVGLYGSIHDQFLGFLFDN